MDVSWCFSVTVAVKNCDMCLFLSDDFTDVQCDVCFLSDDFTDVQCDMCIFLEMISLMCNVTCVFSLR